MKAYLYDQISMICFFYAQITVVLIVAQLAAHTSGGSISSANLFYIVLLVSVFLILHLYLRYLRYKDFYQIRKMKVEESVWLPDPPDKLTMMIKDHYTKQYEFFKEQNEKLGMAKKQESIFMQQWVHQMKTPLSVMQLTLEKERNKLPNELHKDIEEEIDRLKHGLQLALYQSRFHQFERDFHVEKISIEPYLQEIIGELKSSFIRNQVYPKLEISENAYLYSDKKWLAFVLQQILTNAIKYAAKTKTAIICSSTIEENTFTLFITDKGVGIQEQDVNRVFEPFFTGENGRHFRESTGMGLYLAKEICDALGHEISVSSSKNNGTTVSIQFTNLTKM